MKIAQPLLCAAAAAAAALSSCQERPTVEATYQVVPLPSEITLDPTAAPFRLTHSTRIVATDSAQLSNANIFAGYVASLTGFTLEVVDTPPSSGYIRLTTSPLPDATDSNPEAYTISITPDSITVSGGSPAGSFYGLQTLRKAIPGRIDGTDVLYPSGTIADAPRFAYRGAHFDTSRHFFAPDSLRTFIDMLALHNMNRFHWHLTDDQGWRIELKSLPRLAQVGANRAGTVIVEGNSFKGSDNIPYGGYYTQQQVRDIISYAAARHITVIPEIDLPGHMQAALAAYPNLGCTGGPYEVWQSWGVSEDVLCAGNDSVYTFIGQVLDEIADIFPSEYVHIGGDECPKTRWEACPKCQARIKALGLTTDSHSTAEDKLQSHVMKYAASRLAAKGRKAIGWDEVLEGGCDTSTVIMSWRGVDGGITAARAGHDAIMTPATYLYFDYKQSHDKDEPGAFYAAPLLLDKVYGYEPMPSDLTPQQAAHIIGVQGNTWCEYITTFRHAQYMTLPRYAALAELQWTTAPKDFDAFLSRLAHLRMTYDAEGYNYNAKAFTRQAD